MYLVKIWSSVSPPWRKILGINGSSCPLSLILTRSPLFPFVLIGHVDPHPGVFDVQRPLRSSGA